MYVKQRIDYFFGYSLLIFCYIASVLSLNSNPFSNYLPRHDSSMFMYFGKGMSEGLIPYIDMFDHKGLVLFWIEQLGITIGHSNNDLGIWIMECLFILIVFVFLTKTAKLFSKDVLSAGIPVVLLSWVFISSAQGGNLSEVYALAFISVSIFYFSKYVISNSLKNYEFILVGITGSLTFFLRPNMIALWIVMCLYILFSLIIKRDFKHLGWYAFLVFFGGIIICSLVILYGLIVGNLKEMMYQTFFLNIHYSNGNGLLSKFDVIISFIRFMNDSYLLFFSSISILLFFYLQKYIKKGEAMLFCLSILYAGINFLTVVMSGRYYLHYFITMIPAFFILFSLPISWINRKSDLKILWPIALAILVFTANVNIEKGINKIVDINMAELNQKTDTIDVKIAKYIKTHSSKNDSIYVHGMTANIYLQSERFSNSKFFVLPSLDYTEFPNLQSEFKTDLVDNPPLFIVMKKEIYESKQPNDTEMNNIVINIVNKNYKVIPEFKTTNQMLFQFI